MAQPLEPRFRIGACLVDTRSAEITRGEVTTRVEDRTLRLLVCLAERADQTVGVNALLDTVWAGTTVSQDSVYQAVTSLRRALGDDPKRPTYIATVPRQGYRLVAEVGPASGAPLLPAGEPAARRRRWPALVAVAATVPAVVVALVLATHPRAPGAGTAPARVQSQGPTRVAILPFIDITSQSMSEEYFADGMTEELVTRLAHAPGLRVTSATDSFALKGKPLSVAEIARTLNVTYLVDGSLRRSGATLRVSARLVRAADGVVVWSESYDRGAGDLLQIQGDIAGHVADAVKAWRPR